MRTLHAKLSGVLLGLLLVLGAITALITVSTSQRYLQEVQQKLHRDLAAHMVEDPTLFAEGREPAGVLKQVFEKLMVINPDIEIYLLDEEGRILDYSAPPGRVQLERVSLGPILAFLEDDARAPTLGTDPRDPGGENIFSVAPIHRDGRLDGYLYIVLASEQLDSVAGMLSTSYILRAGVWMVGGSLLLALAGGIAIFGRLTVRLRGLAGEMSDFERSADEQPSASRRGDEIDRLEDSFDAMSTRITQQLRELEQQDRLRRDMLANISHDVRTPLTHLQGYLETLLIKEDSLTAEERREYLQIATQQSEQLSALVSDLFELAKLDSISEPLEKEPFSIAELVQDVAQEFRLAAREKGVELDAEIQGAPVQVSGNIAAIARVLQNLLENALRHSAPGDRIRISVERHGDAVRVSVSDTGPGIPPEERERIFDRFYTRATHLAPSTEGSGLGLSIAKRALELHDSDLTCESEQGSGTTFLFELPRQGFPA